MRAKWAELNRLQQVLLILTAVMTALFVVLYLTVGRQQGIVYRGAFLRRSAEGETTVYAGKLDGLPVAFTVRPGLEVEYRQNDALYGPYSIVVDLSVATGVSHDWSTVLSGGEIRQGEQVLFRGGWYEMDYTYGLVGADGSTDFSGEIPIGKVSDSGPKLGELLKVALSPRLQYRGSVGFFFLGTLIAVLNGVSILFADALFRFRLGWMIEAPDRAVPAGWELFSRAAGWIFLSVLALVCYVVGLTAI